MTSQELAKLCLNDKHGYGLIKNGDNIPYVYLHDTVWVDTEQAIKLNTSILENAPVHSVLEVTAVYIVIGGQQWIDTISCYQKDINQNWKLF